MPVPNIDSGGYFKITIGITNANLVKKTQTHNVRISYMLRLLYKMMLLHRKKIYSRLGFVLVASCVMVTCSHAQQLKRVSIQALPNLYYMPETRWSLGANAYAYFSLSNDSTLRRSNVQLYSSYTLNKQFLLETDYQIFLAKDKIYMTGLLDYTHFPELYFGIGNETMLASAKSISFNLIKLKHQQLYTIRKYALLGFVFQYQSLYNIEPTMIGNMACVLPNELSNYRALGAGPMLLLDKRDNPLNPSSGYYVELGYTFFRKWQSGFRQFSSCVLDMRKYQTTYSNIIWNASLHVESSNGDVPFRMLPELGGARHLRGYYRGRFRDKKLLVLQQELRRKIYKRVGAAVFGGVGKVGSSYSDLFKNRFHYSFGAGLRLQINRKENTNLRIDYGVTKDSRGIYIVFAEAF